MITVQPLQFWSNKPGDWYKHSHPVWLSVLNLQPVTHWLKYPLIH